MDLSAEDRLNSEDRDELSRPPFIMGSEVGSGLQKMKIGRVFTAISELIKQYSIFSALVSEEGNDETLQKICIFCRSYLFDKGKSN